MLTVLFPSCDPSWFCFTLSSGNSLQHRFCCSVMSHSCLAVFFTFKMWAIMVNFMTVSVGFLRWQLVGYVSWCHIFDIYWSPSHYIALRNALTLDSFWFVVILYIVKIQYINSITITSKILKVPYFEKIACQWTHQKGEKSFIFFFRLVHISESVH